MQYTPLKTNMETQNDGLENVQYLLLNMAIVGIYVKFLRCISYMPVPAINKKPPAWCHTSIVKPATSSQQKRYDLFFMFRIIEWWDTDMFETTVWTFTCQHYSAWIKFVEHHKIQYFEIAEI